MDTGEYSEARLHLSVLRQWERAYRGGKGANGMAKRKTMGEQAIERTRDLALKAQ